MTFDDQKLYDGYATALSKAWETYIKLIDLLIGLAGATALVFVASIKVADWTTLPNRNFIVAVFISSAASLVCGILWRVASQYCMEYETLGSVPGAKLYFESAKIEPITTIRQNTLLHKVYRLCFKVLAWPTGVFLLFAWASIFYVLFGSAPKL